MKYLVTKKVNLTVEKGSIVVVEPSQFNLVKDYLKPVKEEPKQEEQQKEEKPQEEQPKQEEQKKNKK